MADTLSIGNILITAAIVIIAMQLGQPLLTIYNSNATQTANATIGTSYNTMCKCVVYGANTVVNAIVGNIYDPLNQSAYLGNGTKANPSGNFYVSSSTLQGLGGLAFFYVGIGQFFSQITTLGTALPNIISTLAALMPGVTVALALDISLILSFITVIITLRFIIVGIISIVKVDLWSV